MKVSAALAGAAFALAAATVEAQPVVRRATIQSMSAGAPAPVVDANGQSINLPMTQGGLGLTTLADEHSTIFPPSPVGPFDGRSNYLLFVPTKTPANRATSGLVVLQAQPTADGLWIADYVPGYGAPSDAQSGQAAAPWGQLFISPVRRGLCPDATDATQDLTFDLNYANPGSVLVDPTDPTGTSLFMIYEGTNVCIGRTGGKVTNGSNHFYSTIGVATAWPRTGGRTWPYYDYKGAVPPPQQVSRRTGSGPHAPAAGRFATDLCFEDYPTTDCARLEMPWVGRYPVLGPPYTLADAGAAAWANPSAPVPLPENIGNSAPGAFIDDANTSNGTFVYAVYNRNCDPAVFTCPGMQAGTALALARAQILPNGVLRFYKWFDPNAAYGVPTTGSFAPQSVATASGSVSTVTNDGLGSAPPDANARGGLDSPLFPADPGKSFNSFESCQHPDQFQSMGSISYVDATSQYVLTFVCSSPRDPAAPAVAPPDGQFGRAWFYSTSDSLTSGIWSTPKEVSGTWEWLQPNGQIVNNQPVYCIYSGWYPSFMSTGTPSGHLGLSGYAFSMNGCTDTGAGRYRIYESRPFTFTVG